MLGGTRGHTIGSTSDTQWATKYATNNYNVLSFSKILDN